MNDIFRFFFKGEIPPNFLDQKLSVKENNKPSLNVESSEYVELNELQIDESSEIKLRSDILKLFAWTIVIALFICIGAAIAFSAFGKEVPKIIEWIISGLVGCIVGCIATYFGVKNAQEIVSKN